MHHLSPKLLLALVLLALAVSSSCSDPSPEGERRKAWDQAKQLEEAADLAQETERLVATLATGLTLFRAEFRGRCPTIQDLKDGRYLHPSKAEVDSWGNEIVIECSSKGSAEVISRGPDGELGTVDDIKRIADTTEPHGKPGDLWETLADLEGCTDGDQLAMKGLDEILVIDEITRSGEKLTVNLKLIDPSFELSELAVHRRDAEDQTKRLAEVGKHTFEDDTSGLKYAVSSGDDYSSEQLFFAYCAVATRDGEARLLKGPGWSAKAVTHDIVWLGSDGNLFHRHGCPNHEWGNPSTRASAKARGFAACEKCKP